MSGLVGGSGAGIGALLASFVFLIASSVFPGEAFAQWGWRRFMFFSPFFNELQQQKAARTR
jgi:MHS family proline/betaine transporter-like MFS transporter